MPFKNITCKLGNMRKEADWVLYPKTDDNRVKIQCDRRIAMVDLEQKKAVLSGSHNYPTFDKLRTGKVVDVPDDIINRLKELQADNPSGPVRVL